jgi:hypothetical protein
MQPGAVQRAAAGLDGEVGQGLVVGQPAAVVDARAPHDPVRVDADPGRDRGVADDRLRQRAAEADDPGRPRADRGEELQRGGGDVNRRHGGAPLRRAL